jgi:hypothetical protein
MKGGMKDVEGTEKNGEKVEGEREVGPSGDFQPET